MANLHWIDWGVIGIYGLFTLGLGLAFRQRASQSTEQYFLSGRSLPWWVLGTSMVATTFASDTPLAVTGYIRNEGIWFNWFGWHYLMSQMLAVFLFSRFWRRAMVMTDNELIELRYSGKPAAVLRGFKAGYFAIIYNFIVLGWVLKGIGTVAEVVLDIPHEMANWVIVGAAVFAVVYALLAGFWGVVITDMVQFCLAMFGSIFVAISAYRRVGGMTELRERITQSPLFDEETMAFIPGGGLSLESDFFKFLVFVVIMWWASHNADGGGYLIQRMAAAKNERHAQGATLWYVVAHNAIRYWPWIMVGLCSLVLFPKVPEGMSEEAAYPLVMLEVLGPGLLGILLVSFFAAFMSTVDTHLNWGASYLINDIYRRFLRPEASEKEAIIVAKISLVVMISCAALIAFSLTSIGKAWLFVWAMGAGIGPVLILRWFWWRINAWSEIAALGCSVLIAVGFEIVAAVQTGSAYQLFVTPATIAGTVMQNHHKALILVPATLAVWLTVTLLTPPVTSERLTRFYRLVRPGGWWGPVARACPEVVCDGLCWRTMAVWATAVLAAYCLIFGIGKLVLAETGTATVLLSGALVGTFIIVQEMRRPDV